MSFRLKLLRYKTQAFGALAVKALPLIYGGSVIIFVNTRLPRGGELGVYSLAMATFFAISMLGKSFALFPLIKHLAEDLPAVGIWKVGCLYWVATQLLGAAGVWVVSPWAPGFFHAPGLEQGLHWSCFLILAFIPRDLASALLQSRREIGRLFILEGFYFLLAAGGIVFLALGGSLSTSNQVLGLNLAAGILSSLAAPFLCFARMPRWAKAQGHDWSKMTRFGRDSLGIGVGDVVYNQLDYHLLGFFCGASEVALYFAAKNFFRFYNAVTQAINLLIFPTSSNLFARGELQKLRELVEKVMGSYIALLLPLNALVIIGADWIVAHVYRGIFPDAANILRIFALAGFFEPLYMISANVLYGIGKPRAILIALWSSLVIFLALSISLMPRFGAIGGALSILGTLLSLAAITTIYLRRELNTRLLRALLWGLRNMPSHFARLFSPADP